MLQKIRYRLVFNRSGRLNLRGEGLIQIECSQAKRKIYFSTRTYVLPERFRYGHVTGVNAEALNYALYSMIYKIEEIELEYIRQGKDISLAALKTAVRYKPRPVQELVDFGMEMLDGCGRASGTISNYMTLLNDVRMFRKGVLLSEVDYAFIADYDRWMKDKGLKHNTRISRLRLLRSVMNEALKRDIIGANPFSQFKIPCTHPRSGYLTLEQLRLLEALELNGREEIVRDAFLLCCWTGLRFSDIVSLKRNEIVDGWLVKKIRKTGVTVEIPLKVLFGGAVLEIVEKYGGNIEKLTARIGSNQSVNRILKRIFVNAGLPDRFTFHTSRHTCAMLLGNSGVDISVIQKVLGHARLQTTFIYREVDRAALLAGLSRSCGIKSSKVAE